MTQAGRSIRRNGLLGGAAQGMSSLANALVAATVAHELGARALGQFGLLFTLMTVFVALQTAWVGDSLVVLGRERFDIRRGISSSQWLHGALVVVVAPAIALMTARVGIGASLAFGVLTVAWQFEEFGRRALMARLEFGRQVVGDSTYLVTAAGLVATFALQGSLSLMLVFVAMATGAAVSFVVEMKLLPPDERLQLPKLTGVGLAEVARFGAWRSAQSGSGYLGQILFRYSAVAFGSFAVLGSLEAARIIAAPVFVLTAAAGNVLLPLCARADEDRSRRLALRASSLLVLVILTYASAVIAFRGFAVHVITGGHVDVSSVAIIGWLVVAGMSAITGPLSVVWLARRESKFVFRARSVGTVLGLISASALCAAGATLVAPLGLALGTGLSGAFLLRRPVHIDVVPRVRRSSSPASLPTGEPAS